MYKSFIKGFLVINSFFFCTILKAAEITTNDIVMFSVENKLGIPKLGQQPFHLTYRAGYDNQPKFSLDGEHIYFTRMSQNQTDIYSYSFKTKRLKNITNTLIESEYSATPYMDGFISVIGVNDKGQQHLRKIHINTGEQEVFTEDIEPVGYHAWLTESQAAVFVLGDVMTLQLLETNKKQQHKILAQNIGRCLETVSQGVSFTVESEGAHHIKVLTKTYTVLDTGIVLPKGVQDYVWWDEQHVITAKDGMLLLLSKDKQVTIADLATSNIKGMSRLSLNGNKDKLAIVYNR